jgi:hypothetical protein
LASEVGEATAPALVAAALVIIVGRVGAGGGGFGLNRTPVIPSIISAKAAAPLMRMVRLDMVKSRSVCSDQITADHERSFRERRLWGRKHIRLAL